MYSIAFHIQKGGVGKTSIAGILSAGLARRNYKVILIDCDPQGNASSWFCTKPFSNDIVDVLAGRASLNDSLYHITQNFTILPVFAIGCSLRKWAETELINSPRSFDFMVSDLADSNFDFAIFDCSPSFSQLERAVIASVNEVINPLTPEYFSVDGIEIFNNERISIEKANRKIIKNNKIIVNMVNKSFNRHNAFSESLKTLKYQLFSIPQDSHVAECQIFHKSLYDFDLRARSIASFEFIIDTLVGGN
jgi:cellulose biosynthesis protein BcsQ